jgi:hypothetical protein
MAVEYKSLEKRWRFYGGEHKKGIIITNEKGLSIRVSKYLSPQGGEAEFVLNDDCGFVQTG